MAREETPCNVSYAERSIGLEEDDDGTDEDAVRGSVGNHLFFFGNMGASGDTPPPQPPGNPRARSVGVNGCEKGMSGALFGGDQDDDQLITNSRSRLMTL